MLRNLAKTALFLLCFCSAIPSAFAQATENPIVKTELIIAADRIDKDGNFWAGVSFTMPKGWHIYWKNPGDSGIAPTLGWQLPSGIKASAIHWPAPIRFETSGIVNYGYANRVVLPVPIHSKAGTPQGIVKVTADWLACADVCIPESAELSVNLSTVPSPERRNALKSSLLQVPTIHIGKSYVTRSKTDVTLAVKLANSAGKATLFPASENWISASSEPRYERRGDWLIVFAKPSTTSTDSNHEPLNAVIKTNDKNSAPLNVQISATSVAEFPKEVPAKSGGLSVLLTAMAFALIGGLILNLMPCVLPILSLKALSLAKIADHSRREAALHGIAYTFGILLSFAAIGITLLALKAGGEAVGWGFQLQSPAFVLALLIIVTLVALNLCGLFEFPTLFGNAKTQQHGLRGSFATGVLAVALATPCTAPFMAPALGAALTQPPLGALAIMLCVGLGLALPYLLISISPTLRRFLPKSGAWMNRFKQFLAFPMFATSAWLLFVLLEQTGSMGLLTGFAVVLILALSCWGIATSSARLSRLFWWAIALITICTALIYPPRTMSNTMPALQSSYSVETEPFSLARIEALRAQGKGVFVDATAAWCLTCRINERLVLKTDAVQTLMSKNSVTLMIADWTNRDAAITDWITSFGRNGVPLYVYYPPVGEPKVLPSILSAAIVERAISPKKP